MSALTEQVDRLLRSGQAAPLAERARRWAAHPRSRRVIEDLRGRLGAQRRT